MSPGPTLTAAAIQSSVARSPKNESGRPNSPAWRANSRRVTSRWSTGSAPPPRGEEAVRGDQAEPARRDRAPVAVGRVAVAQQRLAPTRVDPDAPARRALA